jgi:hypothetical protein
MSSRKDAAPVGDSRYLFHRRDTKCTASFLAIIELVNVKTLKLPARIIAVSFRPVMPRRVAPQQSPLPLRRLAYCLDEAGTMPRRPTCNQFPGLTDGVQSRESESLISWMGGSRREAAEQFDVSVSSAIRWLHRFHNDTMSEPMPRGGSISPLEKYSHRIPALITNH